TELIRQSRERKHSTGTINPPSPRAKRVASSATRLLHFASLPRSAPPVRTDTDPPSSRCRWRQTFRVGGRGRGCARGGREGEGARWVGGRAGEQFLARQRSGAGDEEGLQHGEQRRVRRLAVGESNMGWW